MRFRVTNWKQVFLYSALITALAVAVPLVVVDIALYRVPLMFKLPILMISGLIPLFITAPVSIFALHMFRVINRTVDALDALVKFDALTGLLGRSYFLQTVKERRGKFGYMAIVDADHFKKVNDTYGHEAGDLALKHLATIMAQVVGHSGCVGRMGGEEFAIYLPNVSREQAKLVAASIGSALRVQKFQYDKIEIGLSVSIGLAADDGLEALPILLRRADLMLYRAKHNGRDRFEFETQIEDRQLIAS